VSVGDTLLTAEQIFINVGGRPRVPSFPGIEQVPFLTSTSLLRLETLPAHLIVIGGSYVGLEFAQMYRRFGSEVTVIEKEPRLLPREDAEFSVEIQAALEAEDIQIRVGAECIHLGRHGESVVATVTCVTGAPSIVGSHVLLAAGREPNTGDLCLEKAGVALDQAGYIKVDEELRTNISGIWAMGDCNGKALFIDPPLGRVGLTEREALSQRHEIRIGSRPMTRVARATEKGETRGLMKIIVDAHSNLILGASILGVGADEAVHSVIDMMATRSSYMALRNTVHIHPTVAELIPTILGELGPVKKTS
jgi:pyruvate/2-oxoglutarate dehydrogenase complex dihydrolipoamide dehydrogenase (E3) component